MQEKELAKAKNFYTLMCWAGFLIILLPVGIANFVFGYMLGDSPCTLCWAQRESMIFIGVVAFFIVRYGVKGKYIAWLLIMAAFGLYQSFSHYGNHAHRDLDQGFSLQVFGLHTYFWAEVVFWAVVVLLGAMFYLAPRFGAFEQEMNGEKVRKLGGFALGAFVISAVVIASNVFQAFVATGVPPFSGQSDPVRFSLNPKYIIWSSEGTKKIYSDFSFLGKRDVKAPDYAFAPNEKKLGITFDNESANSPFARIDRELHIQSAQELPITQPLNSLAYIDGEFVGSSKFEVLFMDRAHKIIDSFEIDPFFSATIDPIIGVIPYLNGKYILMGSNKTYLCFGKNDNADEALQFADFVRGGDRFEGQGSGLGRGRIDTVRSKFHHTGSIAADSRYFYMATLPNNLDKQSFVISKYALSDRILSGEFTPKADLKDTRSLGELYITALTIHNGNILALSKNYNVIAEISPVSEEIVRVWSYPSEISNARALVLDSNVVSILSYQDGKNILYHLR